MWPYGTTDTEGKDTKSFIVPKVSVCLWQRNIINVHDNYLTLKSQKYAWNSFWFSRKTLENFLPQICQYKTFYCSALKKNATFWNFLFLKYESICYSLL